MAMFLSDGNLALNRTPRVPCSARRTVIPASVVRVEHSRACYVGSVLSWLFCLFLIYSTEISSCPVYSDTKFEELANLIYRGNDYMHF